jgi:hypothetical protein
LLSWPLPARAEWALAFGQGPDGAWRSGTRSEAESQQFAVSGAIAYCSNAAIRCKVLPQGHHGCVALAVSLTSNGYGYARRDSLGAALGAAMTGCVSSNPVDARSRHSFAIVRTDSKKSKLPQQTGRPLSRPWKMDG